MSARAGQGDIVFSLSGQGCAMLQVSCYFTSQCLHVLVREILYSHYQDKAVLCCRLVVTLPVNVCTCWSGRYCILTIRTRLCYVAG